MKLAFLLVACLSPSCSQASDSQSVQLQGLKELHFRALRVVQAEKAREKQPLCPKAANTVEINTCYASELGITDGNYLTLANAIGALLRSGDEAAADAKPAPIPFDTAEASWKTYREQACNAATSQYQGGTARPSMEMGCRLTLTRHHMDELWAVYSDLGAH